MGWPEENTPASRLRMWLEGDGEIEHTRLFREDLEAVLERNAKLEEALRLIDSKVEGRNTLEIAPKERGKPLEVTGSRDAPWIPGAAFADGKIQAALNLISDEDPSSSSDRQPAGGDAIPLRPGAMIQVDALPLCDFCRMGDAPGASVERAEYDFKTTSGPWANGCETHWVRWRLYPDLGTGKGQKLVVRT